jgi:protein-S-isoprenylcysteine O-methyltransferase Ste14
LSGPAASWSSRGFSFALLLDMFERIALSLIFVFMAVNFVHAWMLGASYSSVFVLVSEAVVVVFVVSRRLTEFVSVRPGDWMLAVVGTTAPLLVQPTLEGGLAPIFICTLLMIAGLGIQFAAKLTLRRSFGAVAANRGVRVGGPYRLIRHPMYAGYLLLHIGFLLSNPSWWNAAIYLICQACQVGRILAEERLLGKDVKYRDFAAQVRYRIIPGIF